MRLFLLIFSEFSDIIIIKRYEGAKEMTYDDFIQILYENVSMVMEIKLLVFFVSMIFIWFVLRMIMLRKPGVRKSDVDENPAVRLFGIVSVISGLAAFFYLLLLFYIYIGVTAGFIAGI